MLVVVVVMVVAMMVILLRVGILGKYSAIVILFVIIVVVLSVLKIRNGINGGGTFREGVLVVVHPDFENTPFNSDITANPIYQIFIGLLHFPTHSLS